MHHPPRTVECWNFWLQFISNWHNEIIEERLYGIAYVVEKWTYRAWTLQRKVSIDKHNNSELTQTTNRWQKEQPKDENEHRGKFYENRKEITNKLHFVSQ